MPKTFTEIATECGCSSRRLRNFALRNQIKACRLVGGVQLFDEEACARLIEFGRSPVKAGRPVGSRPQLASA